MFVRAWSPWSRHQHQRGVARRLMTTFHSQHKLDLKELNDFFPAIIETIRHETNNCSQVSITELLEYSIGGKALRGAATFNTMRELTGLTSPSEVYVSKALAWSVELVHAGLLLLDDISDDSVTRRGRPCWHLQVGPGAVFDGFALIQAAARLTRVNFKGDPSLDILNLLQNTIFEAILGQNYDIHSSQSGQANFDEISHQRYQDLCKYKTSNYSFYLPVGVAMFACGFGGDAAHLAARDIASHMGLEFQIQDDFLDCYGSFSQTGKKGTDIRNGKCTWLIAEAKQRANPKQLKELKDNYGFDDEEKANAVLQLYDELKVKDAFIRREQQSLRSIEEKIEKYSDVLPPSLYNYVYEYIRRN